MMFKILALTLLSFIRSSDLSCLYPYESETRQTKSLNGLWSFKIIDDSTLRSHLNKNDKDVIKMPVPSSFNDITTNATIRDHFGLVVYQPNSLHQQLGRMAKLEFSYISEACTTYLMW
ncbi:beta-glucuronidase-like [Nilaparvata lugens]|uniref:beta-glucuronidase-like n=1 Tax=Nilaparvata lugens TaxID=108931 RepID=UPI00193CAB64|nr:beta-glucuronidase-like [Nilaparvata lugens]